MEFMGLQTNALGTEKIGEMDREVNVEIEIMLEVKKKMFGNKKNIIRKTGRISTLLLGIMIV